MMHQLIHQPLNFTCHSSDFMTMMRRPPSAQPCFLALAIQNLRLLFSTFLPGWWYFFCLLGRSLSRRREASSARLDLLELRIIHCEQAQSLLLIISFNIFLVYSILMINGGRVSTSKLEIAMMNYC